MLKKIFDSIIRLIFPSLCLSCDEVLYQVEPYLCTSCWGILPELPTNHLSIESIKEKFWGQIPIRYVSALYYFTNNSPVQKLLHKIKYDCKSEAAFYLGKYYGKRLAMGSRLLGIDLLMPIPLHSKRLVERGFNQSEAFAKGIGIIMQTPVDTTTLTRRRNTATQTDKTREERLANVQGAFGITSADNIEGKHILLVDDLITTGATITAASEPLIAAGAASISAIAMAVAF
ncbi:MAG: phosphoribosyltransferase family protein [Bacteroidota bacterium]